ncbi:MAG: lytic transglycosylase domain-containing protein [Treponema sp.]|jgi:soluble lytic murein transglycosylase-like protein|nr:lytic transglycosylase domain-containing protein [Treponema sp.]
MKRKIYKIDAAYPFFCAMVVSAFICAHELFPRITAYMDRHKARSEILLAAEEPPAEIFPEKIDEIPAEEVPPALIMPSMRLSLAAADIPAEQDEILAAYRNPESRSYVVSLFGEITRSQELAQVILSNTDIFNISPSLAFALCWEESRFRVRAVNHKNRNGSIDRGLFQLNDKSFPHLEEKEYFDPRLNSYYGLSHLRWCLDTAGSLVAGIAMYNAGTNRVSSGSTPKTTLDYVSNILASKQRIEAFFEDHQPKPPPPVVLAVVQEEEIKPEALPDDPPKKPRMAFLSPPW